MQADLPARQQALQNMQTDLNQAYLVFQTQIEQIKSLGQELNQATALQQMQAAHGKYIETATAIHQQISKWLEAEG
ncbi:MAG TPA: hypothetical protein ENN77_00380 [Candidatus Wirthbacteria bacterium]|nr:hypothetical protein [Candidatus Wirthbacteria bacterium]